MPYIPPKVLAEIKKIDLLTYLKNYEPDALFFAVPPFAGIGAGVIGKVVKKGCKMRKNLL